MYWRCYHINLSLIWVNTMKKVWIENLPSIDRFAPILNEGSSPHKHPSRFCARNCDLSMGTAQLQLPPSTQTHAFYKVDCWKQVSISFKKALVYFVTFRRKLSSHRPNYSFISLGEINATRCKGIFCVISALWPGFYYSWDITWATCNHGEMVSIMRRPIYIYGKE